MKRFFRTNDLSIAVILLSYWAFFMTSAMWGSWSIDMSAIYMAGHFAAYSDPSLMYAAPPDLFSPVRTPEFDAFLAAYNLDNKAQTAFVYPPIWAYAVAPLAARLDPIAFFDVTRIVTTASYSVAVLVAWRLVAARHMSATVFALIAMALAMATMPYKFAVLLNQPHLLLTLLILLAFERYIAGWKTTAGILLGLVAAVKVTPVLLALIFLADRQWKALAGCLTVAAAFMAASLAVGGVDLHLTFLERLRQIDSLMPMNGLNMNFETVMHDFFVPLSLLDDGVPIAENTAWVSLLSKALLIAALPASLWYTQTIDWADRVHVRLLLLYTAMIFFGPLAWIHYYMLPILLIPGLRVVWNQTGAKLMAILLMIGFSSPLMMAFHSHGQETGGSDIFHAQHTAFFPLALFCVMLPFWMTRKPGIAPVSTDATYVPVNSLQGRLNLSTHSL